MDSEGRNSEQIGGYGLLFGLFMIVATIGGLLLLQGLQQKDGLWVDAVVSNIEEAKPASANFTVLGLPSLVRLATKDLRLLVIPRLAFDKAEPISFGTCVRIPVKYSGEVVEYHPAGGREIVRCEKE